MYRSQGETAEGAYLRSWENITGPIARTISERGLRALREDLLGDDQGVFDRGYAASHPIATELITEIYDEVEDGTELRSVILAGRRLHRTPMSSINRSPMWRIAGQVRAGRADRELAVDPFTTGVFAGIMVAQIDLFAAKGHPWSEIVNESIIEAVDSLLPYMHARDVAYMVDNCSTTARLGARRWGPRFQAGLEQVAFPTAEDLRTDPRPASIEAFLAHPVHQALATAAELRPPVTISV